MVTTAPRQKTWSIKCFLSWSLHLPPEKITIRVREFVMKTLLHEVIGFFKRSKASECLQFTNVTVKHLWLLELIHPDGSIWHPFIKQLQIYICFFTDVYQFSFQIFIWHLIRHNQIYQNCFSCYIARSSLADFLAQ